MKSSKSVGRVIGGLLLVQITGLIVPFVLLLPLTAGPSEYLSNAAASSFQIKLAVFLLFTNCALTVAISIAAFPIFRQYNEALALLLVAVSVIMFSLQAVDNSHILSMLSLSQRFVEAGGQNELYQAIAAAVGSSRRWAHYSELIAIDAWMGVFYSLLYRFAVVPRALAAFGLLTVLLHFTGIILPVWLGYPSVTLMGASMALGHIVLGIWLVARGFRRQPPAIGAEVGIE